MSTKYKNEEKLPKDRMKVAMIGSIIIVLIIAGIGITSFFVGKNEGAKQQSPIPIIDVSTLPNYNYSQQILGQEIYNWTGNIIEKQETFLLIETFKKNSNEDTVSTKITANINNKTNITKWDLTNTSVNYLKGNNKTIIEYDDLNIGDEIIVKSNNDLDQKSQVTATEINLLITP